MVSDDNAGAFHSLEMFFAGNGERLATVGDMPGKLAPSEEESYRFCPPLDLPLVRPFRSDLLLDHPFEQLNINTCTPHKTARNRW